LVNDLRDQLSKVTVHFLIEKVEAETSLDPIEKKLFADSVLSHAAKTFRKRYFGALEYALKYKLLILVLVSVLSSAATTIFLIWLNSR